MIEMVMVISIIGILATIAMPKFADASTGRVLVSGEKLIREDLENAALRARAVGKIHTVVFYPDREVYCIFQGTSIAKDALVLTMNLSSEPYGLDLVSTDLDENYCVISAFGEIRPGFNVQIQADGITKSISIDGAATRGVVTDVSAGLDDLLDGVADTADGVLDKLGFGL